MRVWCCCHVVGGSWCVASLITLVERVAPPRRLCRLMGSAKSHKLLLRTTTALPSQTAVLRMRGETRTCFCCCSCIPVLSRLGVGPHPGVCVLWCFVIVCPACVSV